MTASVIQFELDGRQVEIPDRGASLLDALREDLGCLSVKDGCSPQGQCGCCTVWIDGLPRVSCVTATRRAAGRQVTTVDGLHPDLRDRWINALVETGASQCGFCTPGILMRLAGLECRGKSLDEEAVHTALAAHLCRCTGWQTIVEAALRAGGTGTGIVAAGTKGTGTADVADERDLNAAGVRATIEGGTPQRVGTDVVLGHGGFASDTARHGTLAAVLDNRGEWVTAATLSEARRLAAKLQGRNSTVAPSHPLDVPVGSWALTWQTTFVEPGYLEPDSSWCAPGGDPATALANGGAFGGKLRSLAEVHAQRLAIELGRPVQVVLSREDVIRLGPKRPPIAAGIDLDGRGIMHVGYTDNVSTLDRWLEVAASAATASGLQLEFVPLRVPGPPLSGELRAAGWGEVMVLAAGLDHHPLPTANEIAAADPLGTSDVGVAVTSPGGGKARVTIHAQGPITVEVDGGDPLDETVLRSYCLGAVHQGLGWVRREGIAVDSEGTVLDLTIRSMGVLPSRDMPQVTVTISSSGPAVPVSDAVFVATAAAGWIASGLSPQWPVIRSRR